MAGEGGAVVEAQGKASRPAARRPATRRRPAARRPAARCPAACGPAAWAVASGRPASYQIERSGEGSVDSEGGGPTGGGDRCRQGAVALKA